MRSILIAVTALIGIAACDVSIDIRDKPARDAGLAVEAPDPAAGTTGTEAKPALAPSGAGPAPQDKSLRDELGDVWNRVERDGKELARDAERKIDEIKKDVDVKIEKEDVSVEGFLDKYGWILWIAGIVIGILILIAILDALDLFGGIFELLAEALGALVEVLVKACVAVIKGIGSLAVSVAKAFRRNRGRPAEPAPPSPRPQESDADRELREAEARFNEAKLRKQRQDLAEGRIDPFRGTPRPPAPPKATEPPRRVYRAPDADGNERASAVGAVTDGGAESAADDIIETVADGLGDIDLD